MPHPYSSVDTGEKPGDRPASMTRSIHVTSVSPLAKNSRSSAGVRLAARNRGDVRIAKYGSRRAKSSNWGSESVNTGRQECGRRSYSGSDRHGVMEAWDNVG